MIQMFGQTLGGRLARQVVLPIAAMLLVASFALVSAVAGTANCSNPATLSGSAFEVDSDANLKVDATGCIDWLNDGGSAFRSGVLAKNDKPSGANDDSFGQGTAEDNPNPTIVTGSIPPNKSDLKAFGVFAEANATGKFLELFWSRVQNPSGTTNMDFELNKEFCDGTADHCANNGTSKNPVYKTPKRTTGDKLITYDLSKGGTVPSISIRTWTGSSWGPATVISGGANASALGAVNTSTIPSTETGGVSGGLTTALGSQDPFTFGEASIAYSAIFSGNTCGTFGSAYLKSRSSDSFTAEIKDFVEPEAVQISNCTTLTTSAAESVTIGGDIHDTATLSGATANATGTISFKVYGPFTGATPGADTCVAGNLAATIAGSALSGPDGSGNFTSTASYSPSAVGRYRWVATFTSGDNNNVDAGPTACLDAGELDTVGKKQPSLRTNAAASVTIGTAISDTATLSDATDDASGTITFHLYGPFDASTSASGDTCVDSGAGANLVTTLSNTTVNGNGNYGSGDYTPTFVGRYQWVASYGGDTRNLTATTACKDANEASVVNKKQPSLSTNATGSVTIGSPISDSATLSGATGDASGTITFKLYGPFDASSPASGDTCVDSGTGANLLTTLTNATVNGNGSYGSGDYTPSAVGRYQWVASYGGDAKNLSADTACKDANEASVVGKAGSNIGTAQSIFPQDSATLSATAGGTPTGNVTFKLFGPNNSTCDPSGAAPVYMETVALASGSAATSNSTFHVDSASAETYRWLVVYGGDTNHDGATSSCGTEHFDLTIVNS